MIIVVPEPEDMDWIDLVEGDLPTDAVGRWAAIARCGAVVVFTGTARDHSEGRSGVSRLHYEAYEEGARSALAAVATECRQRWTTLGRIGIMHRVGDVPLTEAAVVVAVSAPHRSEAFEAARFAIDAVKESAPVWKREVWADGDDWGRETATIVVPSEVS